MPSFPKNKPRPGRSLAFRLFLGLLFLALPALAAAPALRYVGVVYLPWAQGRFGYLGVDVKGRRVFLSETGNGTVDVIDAVNDSWLHQIRGLRQPEGALYVPDFDQLYVANRGNGQVDVFNASTYRLEKRVRLSGDADYLRYDAKREVVYAGYGGGGDYRQGALAAIDPWTGRVVGDFPLPVHPESFRLAAWSPLVYVNLPANGVEVFNRDTNRVKDHWYSFAHLRGNYPMALDEADHRLFVAYRDPARLLVYNTKYGTESASLPCVGDAGGVFYDKALKRIYVSGGGGAVSVFQQAGPDDYQSLGEVLTAFGARTSLFVPQFHRLYVAVPHRAGQIAALWVYQTPG